MRKIIIVLIVLVLAVIAYKAVQKKQPVVDAERERKCREFLMVALFPDGAAAEAFMQRCLAGEPVLPGEAPNE